MSPRWRSPAAALALALALSTEPAVADAVCSTAIPRDELSQAEARAIYDCIAPALIAGHGPAADIPGVADFRTWKLVSTAPLISATHGSMFVNHWVNEVGADLYIRWEAMDGAKFPIGTIFAKESFRVTRKGEVRPGSLFLMEKVAVDLAPDGWVYTRVLPNGGIARTNGPDAGKVAFCHDCHAATLDDFDGAFFPPRDYRIPAD